MNDRIIVVFVEGEDMDDDDEKRKATGGPRPNAYWERVRHEQEEEEKQDPDTYTGSFRGVKAHPHGGQATVKPEQTLGSEDCWCGEPAGHDWPGKAQGRKHPRKASTVNTQVAETVDRRDLRAYHSRLQDFIIQCVNDDGLRFRLGKNSCILYPPDGTSPATVYARNSDRQVRQLQKWYVTHVYPSIEAAMKETAAAEPKEVTDEDLARLRETVVDPAEHPAKKTAATAEPEPEEAPEEVPQNDPERFVEPDEREHHPPVEKPMGDGKVRLLYGEEAKAYLRQQELLANRASDDEWVPWIKSDNTDHPRVETNGTQYRCKECLNTDHPLLSSDSRSIGGHNRIYHTDTSNMYGKEARDKAVDSSRSAKLKVRMEEAALLLLNGLGEDSPLAKMDALTKQIAELTRANARLQKDLTAAQKVPVVEDKTEELAAAIKRADEAEARLALMREALNA